MHFSLRQMNFLFIKKKKKQQLYVIELCFSPGRFLNKLNRLEKKQQREKVNNEEVFSKCISNRIPIYTKNETRELREKREKRKKTGMYKYN